MTSLAHITASFRRPNRRACRFAVLVALFAPVAACQRVETPDNKPAARRPVVAKTVLSPAIEFADKKFSVPAVCKKSILDGAYFISPDMKRLACKAEQGGKHFIVVNDQPGPKYDSVGNPVFSPDGSRVVYAASENQKSFLTGEVERGPEFRVVNWPEFSPDGRKLAYVASDNEYEYCVVINNQKTGTYPGLPLDVVFGPNGETVAVNSSAAPPASPLCCGWAAPSPKT